MIQKEKLSALWASVTDVLERHQRIKTLQERQTTLLGFIEGQVQAKKAELDDSLGDLSNTERLSVANRALGSLRRSLIDSNDKARTEILREAVTQIDEIKAIAVHYQSAMQMLMRESLGSSRRSYIVSQIENSGPVELASLASFALATRDLELASALCARNANIKATLRSFSSSDLANGLLGSDFDQVSSAITEIELIGREIINADRIFLTRRTNPVVKMANAMARAELPCTDPTAAECRRRRCQSTSPKEHTDFIMIAG